MHPTATVPPPRKPGSLTSREATSTRRASRPAKGKLISLDSYSRSYFREVSKLVFQHAAAIPRQRVSLFFRHAVRELYDYLYFKPL